MADEAYALSPIAARPSLPSEADYEAIRDVFMETARGRWFLSEYARRNRNADTRMVLEAVSRIETTIAAQKPAPGGSFENILPAILAIVDDGKSDVVAAMAEQREQDRLAPAQTAAQTLREIAWTLRECGTDPRICDLLDDQAKAIDLSLERLGPDSSHDAVLAIFDRIAQRITAVAAGDQDYPAPASYNMTSTQPTSPVEAASAPQDATATQSEAAESTRAHDTPFAAETSGAETGTAHLAVADPSVVSGPSVSGPSSVSDQQPLYAVDDLTSGETCDAELSAADASEIAVLDMIAMEMAADVDDDEVSTSTDHDPGYSQQLSDPIGNQERVPEHAPFIDTTETDSSLGSVLLANGTLPRTNRSGIDPFAAIRRMSQIEKVALFS